MKLTKKFTEVQIGDIGRSIVVDSREDPTERARIRDNAPHAHYAIQRDDIHTELTAFKDVCKCIGPRPYWDVLEMFGGSGWQSAILAHYVSPSTHTAWDISPDCIESIQRSQPHIDAIRADSYTFIREERRVYDWIHADYNLLTPDLMEVPRVRESVAAVFQSAQECVTMTDTSPYGLDPNAVPELFEQFLGAAELFFGWYAHKTVWWGPAAMHLFFKEINEDGHDIQVVKDPMDVKVIKEWTE